MSINEQITTIQCDWRDPGSDSVPAHRCGEEITFEIIGPSARTPVDEHGVRTLANWSQISAQIGLIRHGDYCPRHTALLQANGFPVHGVRVNIPLPPP